jgi:POT family proton-dependent oligopeptide transporter
MNKSKFPTGIPYIIGNEFAERFSYYGMKGILTIFMTDYLLGSDGLLEPMGEEESKIYFHLFAVATYAFPLLGALLSDILWGKYRTIIVLSIVYCAGHIALALDETRLGLSLGLTMIAIGSGGIKPCVSAHVGDQFNGSNSHLLEKMFSVFYVSINMGAAISSIWIPKLLDEYGPSVAFGVPGALMILATLFFWMGRNVYTSVKPSGWAKFKEDVFDKKGLKVLLNLSLIYVFISIFWSLFDQTGSSWVLQAKSDLMNKNVDLLVWSGELLPSQVQAINPILILIFVPIFTLVIYPIINRFYPLSPLRKITIGMFIATFSFVIMAIIQSSMDRGMEVSILGQFGAYGVLTAAEVMVSITALEFSYKQAPNSMKSLVMGLYFLSISFGNGITAMVNFVIMNENGSSMLAGANYFWFFVGLMAVTSLVFIFVAMNYKEKTYIQEHGE